MLLRLRRSASDERGIVIVLVAVMLVVLLGFAAMAVDIGEILWSRRVQQNAADAAALAGVRELPDNPANATLVALSYATDNGFKSKTGEITVTATISTIYNANDSIVATITRTVPPGLRAAVGAGSTDVVAQAIAIVAQAQPPCNIWPFGIERDVMLYDEWIAGNITLTHPYSDTYGQKVILKVATQLQVAPGNFLLLDLDEKGGGGKDIRENIKNGGGCSSGNDVHTKTGGNVGPVAQGVQAAIDATVPGWDQKYPAPENVAWWTAAIAANDAGNGPRPFGLPASTSNHIYSSPIIPTLTPYFGSSNPDDYKCSPPSLPLQPYPPVTIPSGASSSPQPCKRVGIVPILPPNTYVTQVGSKTVPIEAYTNFYLLGTEGKGGDTFVVGAFLSEVTINPTRAKFDAPLTGPLGYWLWR